jgi:uncharacterized protein (TIGR02145 family)
MADLFSEIFLYNKDIIITDIDNNNYNTFTVCEETWMGKNLEVSHYRNGDKIEYIDDPEEWGNAFEGAWCYPDNNINHGKTFGKLYNWYALMDPRGLAPDGWHVSSDVEWTELNDYLGGGRGVEEKLKSTSGWYHNSNGTNESGFDALPGGLCYGNGEFHEISKYCYFWSTLENVNPDYKVYAYCRYLDDVNSSMLRVALSKKSGMSIRCIKN